MPEYFDKDDDTDVYNAMFEGMLDGALMLNKEGVITDMNKHFLQLSGYEQSDILGDNILTITPPGAPTDAYKKFFDLSGKKNKTTFETALYDINKEEIPVEIQCHFFGKHDYGTVLVSCRDITHRHDIEKFIEKNKKSRKKDYIDIINSSPDGLLVMNKAGKIIEANKAYAELSGYTKTALLTMTYFDLIIGKNGAAPPDSIEQNSLFNNYHKTKSGDIIPVHIKVRQMKKKNGIDKVLVYVYTLYEYIEMVDNIKKERKIMEKILAGLTNKDSTGILIDQSMVGLCYANDSICEIFGYTKEEILTYHHLFFIMDQNDPEENIETYSSVIGGKKNNAKFTHRFVRKDGTLFEADLEMTNHKNSVGERITVLQLDNIIESSDTIGQNDDVNLDKIADQFSNNRDTGVLLATTKTGIVYANKLSYESFGYKKDEMYGISKPQIWIHSKSTAALIKNSIKVYSGFKSESSFPCRFLKKENGDFRADVTIKKHKKDGIKYLVLQLDNIVHENTVEAAS